MDSVKTHISGRCSRFLLPTIPAEAVD